MFEGVPPGRSTRIDLYTTIFYLRGEEGAVQFMLRTSDNYGLDIGHHSRRATFPSETPMPCNVLGGECYYDGSSFAAERLGDRYAREGVDAVWTELEAYYRYMFFMRES